MMQAELIRISKNIELWFDELYNEYQLFEDDELVCIEQDEAFAIAAFLGRRDREKWIHKKGDSL